MRDPRAARAAAIRRRVKAFELAGKQVPRHLRELLEGLQTDAPEIDLVDAVTGKSRGELTIDAPEGSGAETPPPPAGPPDPENVEHEPTPVPDQVGAPFAPTGSIADGLIGMLPTAPPTDVAFSAAASEGQESGSEVRVIGVQEKIEDGQIVEVPEVASAPAEPEPQAEPPAPEPEPEPAPEPAPKAESAKPVNRSAPPRRRRPTTK